MVIFFPDLTKARLSLCLMSIKNAVSYMYTSDPMADFSSMAYSD